MYMHTEDDVHTHTHMCIHINTYINIHTHREDDVPKTAAVTAKSAAAAAVYVVSFEVFVRSRDAWQCTQVSVYTYMELHSL